MKTLPTQRRMVIKRPEPEGGFAIRVSHRAQRKRGRGYISLRYLLRCGCCDAAVEIYYGPDDLEINGVYGSIENWREILLPLFRMSQRGKHFIPDAIDRKMPKSSSKPKTSTPVERKPRLRRLVELHGTLAPAEATRVRRGEAQLKRGKSKTWRDVKRCAIALNYPQNPDSSFPGFLASPVTQGEVPVSSL